MFLVTPEMELLDAQNEPGRFLSELKSRLESDVLPWAVSTNR
jgi:hypothetical protein